MKRLSFSVSLSAAVAALAIGCGGGSGSSGGSPAPGPSSSSSPTEPAPGTLTPADATCGTNTRSLCQHACACGTSGTCVIAYGDGGVTEEHKSLADCENFYAFMVCGQAAYAKNYDDATCGSGIAAATCVTTPSKGGAVGFPDACVVKK
jgi:hypothetical protein